MKINLSRSALLLLLLAGGPTPHPVYSSEETGFATPPNTVLAGNRLGRDILEEAQAILDRTTTSHYQHNSVPAKDQVIDNAGRCECDNDCSGFVSYIIDTISPKHYRKIRELEPEHSYPQAKVYAQFFLDLSSSDQRSGWQRVDGYSDLRPGDLIAWQKPSGTGNTGHVMIVVKTPRRSETCNLSDGAVVRYVPIEVIDSSSVSHFPPETLPPLAHQTQRDGVGKGFVRIIVDDHDRPIGYWEGTFWGEGGKVISHPTMTDAIAFARMVPF